VVPPESAEVSTDTKNEEASRDMLAKAVARKAEISFMV
jgi:hypothetical protein